MPIPDSVLNRLRSQVARGELILFTGAGFSTAAADRSGKSLPSVEDLRRELWTLCFPSEPFDPTSHLADLYQVALSRRPAQLTELLGTRLSADPARLPDFYRIYFDFPWHRIYTLNVDDLPLAASLAFDPRRPISWSSATASARAQPRGIVSPSDPLEVVALNGTIADSPELITFSESQFAERIARQEPVYARCVADVIARPVVFIGTELREIPLWQHIELRKQQIGHGRDLRPTSILVTPTLSAARQEVLRTFRVEWIAGTAESFAREVIGSFSAEASQGFAFIERSIRRRGTVQIPLAAELAAERPTLETEYLLGEEPHWSDLLTGRAIERADDAALLAKADEILAGATSDSVLAITGTAGSGKSTALMRLALRLGDRGLPVLWLNRDSEATAAQIRARVRETKGSLVVAIDDADLFGRALISLVQDLVPGRPELLLAFATRSSKVDEIALAMRAGKEVTVREHVIPNLTDSDIADLIATLDRNNRLGALKGLAADDRRRVFRDKAGRQLLVAMIEATSGERFENKVFTELTELVGLQRYVYSLVCVASSLRHFLYKDEILLGAGDSSGDALAAVERLVARHLVSAPPPDYRHFARHRMISELVVDKLKELGELAAVIQGLAFAAAAKIQPATDRRDRNWRFLAKLTNHDYLRRHVGVMEARVVYEQLEKIVNFDYHYWLQRGSLEVEAGDVRLAENFLSQAKSLAPEDHRVETAYAYMLIRKAIDSPQRPEAGLLLKEGMESLENVILLRGDQDPYPFHVLGSQGLAWVRRARLEMTEEERRSFLKRLLDSVRLGLKKHPLQGEMRTLAADLERELLMTAVSRGEAAGKV